MFHYEKIYCRLARGFNNVLVKTIAVVKDLKMYTPTWFLFLRERLEWENGNDKNFSFSRIASVKTGEKHFSVGFLASETKNVLKHISNSMTTGCISIIFILFIDEIWVACERWRIFSVTCCAENNVCEPELENDFCDVGILSQSQFSSEKPRTTARGIHASQEYKVQQQWRIIWMNYWTAARVAARSTRVSFYHALWLAKEKTKVVTSQKSFSSSGSQTLFSAEPVTEKIRLSSQAKIWVTTLSNQMYLYCFKGFRAITLNFL